ncbi:MAG: hypothetical protein WAV50_01485 [Minisyncoccia bacterium]
MKIFQLVGGKYQSFKDCDALQPFSEASLLAQIVSNAADIGRGDSTCLVFSKEEEARVAELSELVVGKLQVNQGMGHTRYGIDLLLSALLHPAGLCMTYVPASGDGNKPIPDIKDWLLAIKRP